MSAIKTPSSISASTFDLTLAVGGIHFSQFNLLLSGSEPLTLAILLPLESNVKTSKVSLWPALSPNSAGTTCKETAESLDGGSVKICLNSSLGFTTKGGAGDFEPKQ